MRSLRPPPVRSSETPPQLPSRALVSKWFASANGEPLHVLQGIDLSVPERSIVAILGASGCGQSTLLNIISGLLKPDKGRVYINGVASEAFSDWRRVSYMFQEDRLLPWRSAQRNVELALEAGSTPRAERARRAQSALQLVGLADFADAFPYQLSGGMRSRVALARSLVLERCILLMDEPFSRLDAQTRALMHVELLRIHALKQMTIVFVTHDVEESVVLADRVMVLAPRPRRVREELAIAIARPRDPTTGSHAVHSAPASADLRHEGKAAVFSTRPAASASAADMGSAAWIKV